MKGILVAREDVEEYDAVGVEGFAGLLEDG